MSNRVIGGATGEGLSENIRSGYSYIANNYERGDEIFLFGFSRGGNSSFLQTSAAANPISFHSQEHCRPHWWRWAFDKGRIAISCGGSEGL